MSVTIKDIAREAGVSYASVSRALSGSRGVSVKTAQRILAVAKKLNYLPNGIARNLVNQRSKTLGLILPDISNPFFSDIALAVIHTAERAGYQTILSNTDWEPRAQCHNRTYETIVFHQIFCAFWSKWLTELICTKPHKISVCQRKV